MESKTYLTSFTTTIEDVCYIDGELKQLRLNNSALINGIDEVISWNRQKLLKTDFYRNYKFILDEKKGAGYWLWKPYIILESLKKIKDGEILIYADSAYFFVNSINTLISRINEDGFSFYFDDTFKIKNIFNQSLCEFYPDINFELIKNENVTIAGFLILRKNQKTIDFVQKWLELCQNEILLKGENIETNDDFMFHKHDMTILSVLTEQYEIKKNKISCYVPKAIDDDTIPEGVTLIWDKFGMGCKRPLRHYFNLYKLKAFFIRKFTIR